MPLFEFCMIGSGSAAFVSVLVRVMMSNTGDFLDALLSEWFGLPEPSCSQSSVPSSDPSHGNAFADSVLDFDLSLVQLGASSSLSSSGEPALFVPRRDSLQVRISEIKDQLGVFYASVRSVRSSWAIESMTLACQKLLDSLLSRDSFSVVRVLDSRSPGVLLRVASLELKHRILGYKDALKCRGLVVGLA